MEGMPNPEVTPESLAGYAQYSGYAYSRQRLEELAPSLRDLMSQIRALWLVDLGAAEMALIAPNREPQP